ncbi:helix-turn-helix domain-containing protein [Massilia sp. NR 4-1]|uniref:helix-turn-helix domain-containing protein n=1 Tax=Massilia sp. NR 4-1 TaxID=1678028 RepID=UPI00067D2BB2|nr:helix-turn-helix transcriptional regulator [Massilia sp. NR 4-1]
MEPATGFGKAVRARRLAAGLSQEQLGLEAGLERVFISWMETGKKQATFNTMLKLAKALNCSAADLVAEAEVILGEARSKSEQ